MMSKKLHSDIDAHLSEIENLKKGLLNNLNTITTANFSHRVCFSKYLASEIGTECKRLRAKVAMHIEKEKVRGYSRNKQ